MSSRIDTIETEIVNVLTSIDQTTQSSGYTYYTKTGSVQLFDENLALARNTDTKSTNHYIYQEDDDGVFNSEFQAGQWALTNQTNYKIKSKVHNIGNESNAKNAIRTKMNEQLDDLLFAFTNRYTLGGRVSWIRFVSATYEYEPVSNNRIQSGTLVTKWEVVFSQSIANPSIKACA
jgi:hypothetical protein